MNRRAIREALILTALAIVLSISYTLVTHRGFFAPPAASTPATSDIRRIDLSAARQAFEQRSALFIDSRHPFEFRLGHIAQAVNIPLAEFDTARSRLDGVSRDKFLIVYCDGSECNSSMDLSVKLMQTGFRNVHVFFGGWEEWTRAGYPTEKTPS